jgi:hypothetical protein
MKSKTLASRYYVASSHAVSARRNIFLIVPSFIEITEVLRLVAYSKESSEI